MPAGAATLLPTVALAQNKPQPAPGTSVLRGCVYGAGRAADQLSRSRCADRVAGSQQALHRPFQHRAPGHRHDLGGRPGLEQPGPVCGVERRDRRRQYRYIWETGEITPFRRPSYNSNGNTFDFQGRQISAQHFLRRVVRFEHDGTLTVIADSYNGQPLNSPNDIAVHKDGSIWFTDPYYGGQLSEGHPDESSGPVHRRRRQRQYRQRHAGG